jgi:hypothetical protein
MNLTLRAQKFVHHYDPATKVVTLDMAYTVRHFKNHIIFKRVRDGNTSYFFRQLKCTYVKVFSAYTYDLLIPEAQAKKLIHSLGLRTVADPLLLEGDAYYCTEKFARAKIKEYAGAIERNHEHLKNLLAKKRIWEGVV